MMIFFKFGLEFAQKMSYFAKDGDGTKWKVVELMSVKPKFSKDKEAQQIIEEEKKLFNQY